MMLSIVGPGLITANIDNDAGGILLLVPYLDTHSNYIANYCSRNVTRMGIVSGKV